MLPGERYERGDDCYAVESRVDTDVVAVELVHYRRERVSRWHHEWVRRETLAAQKFKATDMTGYWAYAGKVDEAARHALDGELGCYVDVQSADDGIVRIRMIERRIRARDLVTEILEDHRVDASAPDAVAVAAELAEDLRARARGLNEAAAAALVQDTVERDTRASGAGDAAREARDLAAILRDEAD